LCIERAEVEKGGNQSFNGEFDILETFKSKDTDVAVKKSNLVNQNNPSVSDNP
jgi:hypothetical protein